MAAGMYPSRKRQPPQDSSASDDLPITTSAKLKRVQNAELWMGIRQALIIAIGAIEDFLGLQRSIVPRRKRP